MGILLLLTFNKLLHAVPLSVFKSSHCKVGPCFNVNIVFFKYFKATTEEDKIRADFKL